MRRKYICTNGVVEVTQYTVGDKTEGGSRWHRAKSQDDKRDENARQAVRVAARILNCNYAPEDYLVTLTYSDESWKQLFGGIAGEETVCDGGEEPGNATELEGDAVWSAAKGVLGKKLDQVRKLTKKAGAEMRTFAVTSDLDQETGELVRVHHHVVVNAEAAKVLEEKWGYGLVHTEHLYKQDDYTPLAAYLLGQVRHVANRKKYSCSRNMVQPKVEEMVLNEAPENEIRVQPGAKVLDRTPYREGCVSQYVRYKRKPSTRKRGGKKLGMECPSGNDVEIAMSATPPRNDKPGKALGANCCGRPEFCEDKSAEGGSGFEFSKIAWG